MPTSLYTTRLSRRQKQFLGRITFSLGKNYYIHLQHTLAETHGSIDDSIQDHDRTASDSVPLREILDEEVDPLTSSAYNKDKLRLLFVVTPYKTLGGDICLVSVEPFSIPRGNVYASYADLWPPASLLSDGLHRYALPALDMDNRPSDLLSKCRTIQYKVFSLKFQYRHRSGNTIQPGRSREKNRYGSSHLSCVIC